jgi:hypothetical protein
MFFPCIEKLFGARVKRIRQIKKLFEQKKSVGIASNRFWEAILKTTTL